jgi:hypothetical protein
MPFGDGASEVRRSTVSDKRAIEEDEGMGGFRSVEDRMVIQSSLSRVEMLMAG